MHPLGLAMFATGQGQREVGSVCHTPAAAPVLLPTHCLRACLSLQALAAGPGIFEDLPPQQLMHVPPSRSVVGRITLYCNAESFDRKKLDDVLHASFTPSAIRAYPDVSLECASSCGQRCIPLWLRPSMLSVQPHV